MSEHSQEALEALLLHIDAAEKIKEADNKKLLWLAMQTNAWKNMQLFSMEDTILGEIENRLYPEYDGEKVKITDYGWQTPEGPINYLTPPPEEGEPAHCGQCGSKDIELESPAEFRKRPGSVICPSPPKAPTSSRQR